MVGAITLYVKSQKIDFKSFKKREGLSSAMNNYQFMSYCHIISIVF